jgi:hypothetical protein
MIVIEFVLAIGACITCAIKVASFWMADKAEQLDTYFTTAAGKAVGKSKTTQVVKYEIIG